MQHFVIVHNGDEVEQVLRCGTQKHAETMSAEIQATAQDRGDSVLPTCIIMDGASLLDMFNRLP